MDNFVGHTRNLSAEQTRAFDTEYVDDELWAYLHPVLARRLQTKPGRQTPRVLDVGGGNGMMIDRILEAFPDAHGIVVEPARELLNANTSSPRKTLIEAMFQDAAFEGSEDLDLVLFNWVLHHFIVSGYRATRKIQIDALRLARRIAPQGRVLVFEAVYDSNRNGRLTDDLPGRIIHGLTTPKVLAPLTSRLGANTAGVGVCFHSEQGWRRIFDEAGFRVASFHDCYDYGELSPMKRKLLQLRKSRVCFFELAPK